MILTTASLVVNLYMKGEDTPRTKKFDDAVRVQRVGDGEIVLEIDPVEKYYRWDAPAEEFDAASTSLDPEQEARWVEIT